MHCNEVEQQLGRYVDGELSPVDRESLQCHLESCASCRAELTELNELVSRIANPGSVTVPEQLWERIEQELQRTDARRDWQRYPAQLEPLRARLAQP